MPSAGARQGRCVDCLVVRCPVFYRLPLGTTLRLLLFCAACLVACFGACGHAYAQTRSTGSGEPEGLTRVVLTNTPLRFDLDSLRQKLEELYPGQFVPPHVKGSFVVPGRVRGQYVIQSNVSGASGIFVLNSGMESFATLSDFTKTIPDGPVRRDVEAQCCWLAVDLMYKSKSEAEAYRFVEQVLAKLAPAGAAFLVDPTKRITVLFDETMRRSFSSGAVIMSSP
jgi:hypothetical protein